MRSLVIISILLAAAVSILVGAAVANAAEQTPGRCVIISEPGKAERLVCDVPPSQGCAEATIVRPDGSILTKTLCIHSSR